MRPVIILQLLPIGRTAFRTAHRIDLQLQIFQPQLPQNLHGQQDNFRICVRTRGSQQFHAKLVELALPACLGPVIPKHGSDIKQLGRIRFRIHFMFNERPHGGSRIFRTQRDAPFTPVNERVHFFFYNIRRIPDATLE